MDLLVKHNLTTIMRTTFTILLFVFIIFFAIWCCLLATDYNRFLNNKPLIFVEHVIIDRTDGYSQEDRGLGYKWIYTQTTNENSSIFYILNKMVKMK